MISRVSNRIVRSKPRRGAAAVEFAVCLPVVLLVVFGSIQAASMLFLRQATIQAAYEGVKVAIRGEGTDEGAREAAQAVLDGRQLTGVTIDIRPATLIRLSPEPRSTLSFRHHRMKTLCFHLACSPERLSARMPSW